MKSRKTKAIVALGLAAVSGFLLMATGFAEETKVIKLDAKNAVQIIPRIIFRSTLSDTANEVNLINVGKLVRINTKSNNFVIYKQENEPHVEGSYSAVLGGERNQIYGASDKSVIIAGEDNTITNAAGGTIGGGKNNTVSSNYGTVAGGQQNTAKEYGTVVGGSQNVAGGGFSVALGSNSEANGNNSVAMGTNATVNGENSFLWSDGTGTLNDSDIFAVVAESGMVVNDEKAHRFAKLTIGGSLLLNEGAKDNEVVCGGGHGEGVVRVVKNDDATDQICFCSCNGKSRQSLFGAGNCNEMCGANPAPTCGTSPKNLVKVCNEDSKKFVYSGTCDVGDVVEGDGAYFVDKDGEVHWTCQTNDGRWQDCHSTVKDVYPGSCEEPEEDGKCSGSYSSNGAQFLEGSNEGFNGIKDATLYPNRTAALGKKCAWYCPDGTEQYGEICRNKNGCPADMIEDYEYGYLDDGAQTGVVKVVAGQTCRNTVVCNDGIPSLLLPTDDCTTNSCIGNYPDGATLSTATPANNTTSWSCSTSTVQACTYTCPSGKVCDGTTGCRTEKHGSCDLSEAYGCGDENSVNKTDTTDSTEWEWYCKGEDDTGDGAYCHKGCPDGKHLKWNATHNGTCVNDVKVKFKVNNNSSSSVVVSKVELGSTTVVEFKNNGGTVGQTVSSHNSVTSDYSTYNFVEGQSYSMRLGYNCVNNQTNCEYINETFTPYAGENLFTFNISDPDPEIYNYKIYWSYTVGSEVITYNMKVKNLDTNRYENMPITVGLASHYTVNARPGGVPASNQVDTIALSENGGSNGNYESTVNIYMNATNGISNIHLTYTNGAVSWQEVRGNKVYNISLEKLSDVAGVCGNAIYTNSLEKPESNLCSVGAPTDPEEAIVGEPGSLGRSWKCGDTDCWTYMPTVTISCTDIINDTSAPQIRLTESYEVAGARVDLRIQGWCSNDERFNISDTFHVYTAGSSPLGIVLGNGAYCNGMGIRSVERVDVVGFSSNKNYNGYRLLAGDSCVYNGVTCGAGQYLPKNSTICSQCPCGYYCPGGSWLKSTTTDQGKFECGAGKWSSAGATSSNSCGNISCGYYGTNACSATPSGQKCATGKYSTAGSSSCSSCSSGQQPNSTQCSCETIPETKYSCNPGEYLKKNSTTCSQCPCGYYCPGGDFTKSTTTDQGIYECGAGKWSSAGATSSNSCGNINCGYYGTNACSATPSGQKCATGKYSTAGSSSCSSCPSGQRATSNQCSCRNEEFGTCDYTEPYYGCGDGNTLNKVDTISSTEWEWYCKGADDTGDGAYCHKGCPEGKTLKWNGTHSGECASPAITINICPYVTYNDSMPYGNCYVGKTLNNLYYVADKAVPKDIPITTTFTYNILRKDEINPDSCIYDSDDKTNTYTIILGSTESYIKPNLDVLHKFATASSSRYGYENYFSTSFLGTIAEDTFTYNGQEYIINLSDIPCSTDTTQPSMSPECGTAINGSYSSAPRLNLCAVGDESVPTRVGTKWKWTCTYGGVSTGCSAGYNPIIIAPECGTSLDKKCDSGTLSGSSDTKWECVSGDETVCCTRSCTTSGLGSSTTTYSCPSYYKMGDDGKCHLYAQFCADDIVCTDNLWGMYGCDYDSLVGDDNPSNKGCGSNSCFGDSKQKADGKLCVRRDSLEYDEYASTHYLYRPVASHHFLTQYNYSTEEKQDHKCAIKYTLDEILSSCRWLQPSNSQDDNGYYIDSCDGGSIPETVDPCSITSGNSGGSTTTCTISQSSGSCKNFEPIPIIGGACQKQCSQCYDNLVDCNENRPDSATSECMEGSPGNSLECYCYKPASTVGICWLTTMYGG